MWSIEIRRPGGLRTLLVMLFAGVVFTGGGLAFATSRARVNGHGIHYRNGLHRVHVPATDIDAFGLGPGSGSGFGPKWVAYVVSRGRLKPAEAPRALRDPTSVSAGERHADLT